MKPLWTQTLVWIVAALLAFLLAFAGLDGPGTFGFDDYMPHGAAAPR